MDSGRADSQATGAAYPQAVDLPAAWSELARRALPSAGQPAASATGLSASQQSSPVSEAALAAAARAVEYQHGVCRLVFCHLAELLVQNALGAAQPRAVAAGQALRMVRQEVLKAEAAEAAAVRS
jgi:hypothetical protein